MKNAYCGLWKIGDRKCGDGCWRQGVGGIGAESHNWRCDVPIRMLRGAVSMAVW